MVRDKQIDCVVHCDLVSDKGCGICTPKSCLDCKYCIGETCELGNLDSINEDTFCPEFKEHGDGHE